MSYAVTLFALSLLGYEPATPATEPRPEVWELTLHDTIKIGLNNSETARLITMGVSGLGGQHFPITMAGDPLITPTTACDAEGLCRFKAGVMAEVRSFEQGYWELAAGRARVAAGEKAVRLAEGVIKAEQNCLYGCRGGCADLAEAQQYLDQFRADLAKSASEAKAAERRLRDVLGLPPEDERRIVPTSTPAADFDAPGWETCVAELMQHNPDVARQKIRVDRAQVQCLAVKNERPATAAPAACPCAAPATVAETNANLVRQREIQEQVVLQASRSLARLLMDAESDHTRSQNAVRARETEARRLDAFQAYFDEGRVTLDRYCEQVSRYTAAVAEEARCMAAEQTSCAAFEEGEGTLLKSRGIVVIDGPLHRHSYIPATRFAPVMPADPFRPL